MSTFTPFRSQCQGLSFERLLSKEPGIAVEIAAREPLLLTIAVAIGSPSAGRWKSDRGRASGGRAHTYACRWNNLSACADLVLS